MIEKIAPQLELKHHDMAEKINELVDASNRQDRAIACLLAGLGNVRSTEGDSLPLRMSHEDADHWKEVATRQVEVNG